MAEYDALFEPITIGSMQLRNRIMLPPHGRLAGNPFGSESDVRRFLAYFGRRAQDGAAWVGGLNCYVEKEMIPGFEPTGLGAARRGDFRLPQFRERAARYADVMHAAGAYATAQLTVQGGMPHSPSGVLANYTNNVVPHVLETAEIERLVAEYAFSAAELKAAGVDGAELHANHEDLLQLFLSPATNHRTDAYGGNRKDRLRIVEEILAAIREQVGAEFVLGIRLNMDEMFDGGYDLDEALAIALALEQTGHLDYLSCVMGNNWGAPSYIQPHHYARAQWSALAGRFREVLHIPVVYTGRVDHPDAAAAILAQGHADVVGIARGVIADDQFMSKARQGSSTRIRPCIGSNDCISRVVVEGMRFGCSVNPQAGRESETPAPHPDRAKTVLVAGGGPAGLELAALLAERGHRVSLWEKENSLGGQLRTAAVVPENAAYRDYLDFQIERLASVGVDVELGREVTGAEIASLGIDVLAVATGALPRRLEVPGADLPQVLEARDLLRGDVVAGRRVLVVAMEDHMQPLTVAGFLTDRGCDVLLVYSTTAVAPLVGKYSIGAPLAKLSAGGARIVMTERVIQIDPTAVTTRNVFSGVATTWSDIDSVVLACGGRSDSRLWGAAQNCGIPETYVLGDAYAPRRISFATRQAYSLAQLI